MLEIENDDMGILQTLDIEKQPKQVDKLEYKVSQINKLPLVKVDQVPSMFKCYPQGTNISYEPMTLEELEILNSGTANVLDGLQFILNAIKCDKVNAEDLLYWDVIYIGIIRKILAFGDIRGELRKPCPSCGKNVSHIFNYTDLDFEELKKGPATITFNKEQQIKVQPLSIKQFLELPPDSNIIDIYARMITNLSLEEAHAFVKNLHGNQIRAMANVEQQLAYGLKPFKIKCPHCKENIELEVRSPFEVVFPENTTTDINDVEIRFGD